MTAQLIDAAERDEEPAVRLYAVDALGTLGSEHARAALRRLQQTEEDRDVKRHIVSAMYGVAFQMRIHTEISNRPATFIIDRDGVIRYERRAKTFADRPSVDDMLAEIETLR